MRRSIEMFPLVEAYQNSELSREVFCEQHGISISTLAYWVGKYRRSKQGEEESAFVQIEMDSVSGNSNYQMEVQTRKGIFIRFRQLAPIDYLTRLLEL